MSLTAKESVYIDEEFNNFMYRVNEVNDVVKKLSSKDPTTQEIGFMEADRILGTDQTILEHIDEKNVVLKVNSDRTVLNVRALKEEDKTDENQMSQEAFMNSVSKDVDMRYKDRLVRTEKMETFKKQATLAFRRGDFERALACYNKAIEQIRDSPLLYNNRCLTCLHLKLYDKAVADAETALKLNEDCLKSYLFLAKAYFKTNDRRNYKWAVTEAKSRHPKHLEFIKDFLEKLKGEEC